MLYTIYFCVPGEAHVEANMAFDDKMPVLDHTVFHKSDWSESICGDIEEEILANAPKPLGHPGNDDVL
jgi:hypothetical protein